MRSAAPLNRDELEFRLLQVIDASPVATFLLNENHVITHWNRACEVLTGTGAAKMIGQRDTWRVFTESPAPVLANLLLDGADEVLLRSIYGDDIRPSPLVAGGWEAVRFWPRKGRWLAITAAPLLDLAGRVVGALETLMDGGPG